MESIDKLEEFIRKVYGSMLSKRDIDSKQTKIEKLIEKDNEPLTLKNYYKYLVEQLKTEKPLLYYFISADNPIKTTKTQLNKKIEKLNAFKNKYYKVTYNKDDDNELLELLKSEFSREHQQDFNIFYKSIEAYLKTKEELRNVLRDDGAKAIYYWFGLPYDKNDPHNDCYKLYDDLERKYNYKLKNENSSIHEIINKTGLKVYEDKKNGLNKIPDKTIPQIKKRIIFMIIDDFNKKIRHKEIEKREFSINEPIITFNINKELDLKKGYLLVLKYFRNVIFTKKTREQKLLEIWINQADNIEVDVTWEEFEEASYKEWLFINKKPENDNTWAYFLKIRGTIFKKITQDPIAKSIANEHLHTIIKQPQALEKEIKLFEEFVKHELESVSEKTYLQAYRFKIYELQKIIELQKLFGENNFVIDLLPEIYYDTYENFENIYGVYKSANFEKYDDNLDKKDDNFINPDYLGCYFDFQIEDEQFITKEGKIILFKDRIETFSYKYNIDINHIKIIVLMHELGHWITHWPKANEANWILGYSSEMKNTHEALANLIAWWILSDDKNLKNIFEKYFTPINKNNPYALYKKLIDTKQSKETIIKKIIDLRFWFFLSDCYSLEYLIFIPSKSDIVFIKNFTPDKYISLNNVEHVTLEYIEYFIAKSLYNETKVKNVYTYFATKNKKLAKKLYKDIIGFKYEDIFVAYVNDIVQTLFLFELKSIIEKETVIKIYCSIFGDNQYRKDLTEKDIFSKFITLSLNDQNYHIEYLTKNKDFLRIIKDHTKIGLYYYIYNYMVERYNKI